MKLIIGNKAYSSWSMRGWLAVRQSGLAFEETVVPLYQPSWETRRMQADLAPSAGKVPMLWDGDIAVWESLAIIDHLAERAGVHLFWPRDAVARGHARAICAEMHAGYAALRRAHSTNYRRTFEPAPLSEAVAGDLARIEALWARARALRADDGPFLYGAFGAADIMFAPVVSRVLTYGLPVSAESAAYCAAVREHPFVAQWYAEAADEPWTIEQFEQGPLQ